ncbi:membrane protein insertase YidC [Spirochaetia bacterium]|nr:membrane protein insertase YidC [Spirochaetia bacterium]
MEKRTIVAIALSVGVIFLYAFIQGSFNSRPQPAGGGGGGGGGGQTQRFDPTTVDQTGFDQTTVDGGQTQRFDPTTVVGAIEEVPLTEQRITIETDDLLVDLTNAGGDIVSFKLKKHKDSDGFVDMVYPDKGLHAFSIAFGNTDSTPIRSLMNVQRPTPYIVEFSRIFNLNGSEDGGKNFKLIKRYEFKPNDYMFELKISLVGAQSVSAYNFGGAAYSLSSGAQIGPKFEKLDSRGEYRKYFTYAQNKYNEETVNTSSPTVINSQPTWAAINGKYFTLIGIPYTPQNSVVFSAQAEPGLANAARLYFVRPPVNSSRIDEDTYRFYLGPKSQDDLQRYNSGTNPFGLSNQQLIEVGNSGGFLSPLETLLKWLLMFFYGLVPNYGVAIILLTLFVKICFFPLTKKSSLGTLKMQALGPKIKELQEKYKDNPAKMNAEMGAFYKKEGFNPLAGCLPMLLQIPIFIAMYNLFNTHFDLRGASFIPVWIPDLSSPESILNFAPFKVPFLGWSDLRLLPFIYVGSQLLYGKVTQTPGQGGSGTQMKVMLYLMPIVFFFILYDVPSGLLIYWIMSNLLTLVQQLIIMKYFVAPKKAAMAELANSDTTKPIIAKPFGQKKKKKK